MTVPLRFGVVALNSENSIYEDFGLTSDKGQRGP